HRSLDQSGRCRVADRSAGRVSGLTGELLMSANKPHLSLLLILALTATISGCQLQPSQPGPDLYQQLGERAGIASIVEDLLFLIVDDERINQAFRGIDVKQFRRNLTDQLCQLSGGPCTSTCREMRELHADMAITHTPFNAVTSSWSLAMDQSLRPSRVKT